MKTLTIGKILHEYRDLLTDCEIEELRKEQRTPSDFATQVGDLERVLFNENLILCTIQGWRLRIVRKGSTPWGRNTQIESTKNGKLLG